MGRTDITSAVFKTGRALSWIVLLLLVLAAIYAGVMAAMNWTAIGV